MMLQERPLYPPFDGGVETSTALSILFGAVGVFLLAHWAWSSRASFKSILQWWKERR